MRIQDHPDYLKACKQVAQDWRDLADRIKAEDEYADHVDEQTKEDSRLHMYDAAKLIEKGEIGSFTIRQRVNEKLTGECVPFLPKSK